MGSPARAWAAVAAIAAAVAIWMAIAPRDGVPTVDIAPAALQAASFADPEGGRHTLGQFAGKVVVLNFWATWCAPCREEMPVFVRAEARWEGRGVRFVGLANEDPRRVSRFARDMGINYPLWVGADEVGELARRLGNRLGALPYTVILDPAGRPIRSKVGAYSEAELEEALREATAEKR